MLKVPAVSAIDSVQTIEFTRKPVTAGDNNTRKTTTQARIFDVLSEHEPGRELKAVSAWLDEHREVVAWVGADLVRHDLQSTGRRRLSVETVLRVALLK